LSCTPTRDLYKSSTSRSIETSDLIPEEKTIEKPGLKKNAISPEQCVHLISNVKSKSSHPILEAYYARIPYITLHTKILPVLYLDLPGRSGKRKARQIADEMAQSNRPRRKVRNVVREHESDKALLREVFLRQGYLFAYEPNLARALSRELKLADLFDEPTLFRLRGGHVECLNRKDDEYLDGSGKRASLLLNDRVALSASGLANPLHIDLLQVRRSTGAVRTLRYAVGKKEAVLELVFPNGQHHLALVEVKEQKQRVVCISGTEEAVDRTLEEAKDFWARHKKVVAAAKMLVAERPRFDEPLDEADGSQEDGDLRVEWFKAYRQGKKKFKLRETEYDVFDHKGHPIPPQVCIDFILDTWERSSGTWFLDRSKKPERFRGEIDFDVLPEMSRRYIPSLLSVAARENTPFQRYNLPPRHWVGFENHFRFARVVAKHADAFREGDMLIIHGLREQDMQEHYHAILILAVEPMTGMPMVIADNQGRPRIGTLAAAMRTAPKRSIKHRIRLDYGLMKNITRLYATSQTQADSGLISFQDEPH
jgi:hypothetical protein